MKTLDEQLSAYGRFIDEELDAVPGQARKADAPRAVWSRRRSRLLAAAVVVVLVVGGVLVWRDAPSTNVAAGERSPLVLLPADGADGFVVSDARRHPYHGVRGAQAVFGRPDSGPKGLVSIEAFVPAGSIRVGFEESEQVRINDATGTLGHAAGGAPTLQWDVGDATLILTGGDAIDDDTAVRIAEGTTLASGSLTAAWLPAGWRQLWDASTAVGAITETSYRLVSDAATYTVTVWTGAPPGAELGIRFPGSGIRLSVRGEDGYLSGSADNQFLAWREAPQVVALVQQSSDGNVGSERITAFAESLEQRRGEWVAFQRDAAVTGDATVGTTPPTTPDRCCRAETLGTDGSVWPAEPAAYDDPIAVVEGFIHWATNADPEAVVTNDPMNTGLTWLTVTLPGGATLQVLAAPAADGGWRIVQVGEPVTYSVERNEIHFTPPPGAETATLSYRSPTSAGTIQVDRDLDEGAIAIDDPGVLESVVIVIRADDGRVLSISGGTF